MAGKFSKTYLPNNLLNSDEDTMLEDTFKSQEIASRSKANALRADAKKAKPNEMGQLNQKADALQNQYDYDFKKAKGELTPQNMPENKNVSDMTYKKGGKVSASNRADGIAQRGKTKGRMC